MHDDNNAVIYKSTVSALLLSQLKTLNAFYVFFYRTTLLSLVQRLRDDDDDDDYYKITCLSKNVAVRVRQKYRNGTSLVAQ